MATREEIVQEILKERKRQNGKWGDAHDDQHSPGEWALIIVEYATRWYKHGSDDPGFMGFRWSMIKVAAIAIAAVEAWDRQAKNHDGTV